jgi:hypothetical protein
LSNPTDAYDTDTQEILSSRYLNGLRILSSGSIISKDKATPIAANSTESIAPSKESMNRVQRSPAIENNKPMISDSIEPKKV